MIIQGLVLLPMFFWTRFDCIILPDLSRLLYITPTVLTVGGTSKAKPNLLQVFGGLLLKEDSLRKGDLQPDLLFTFQIYFISGRDWLYTPGCSFVGTS